MRWLGLAKEAPESRWQAPPVGREKGSSQGPCHPLLSTSECFRRFHPFAHPRWISGLSAAPVLPPGGARPLDLAPLNLTPLRTCPLTPRATVTSTRRKSVWNSLGARFSSKQTASGRVAWSEKGEEGLVRPKGFWEVERNEG